MKWKGIYEIIKYQNIKYDQRYNDDLRIWKFLKFFIVSQKSNPGIMGFLLHKYLLKNTSQKTNTILCISLLPVLNILQFLLAWNQ